MRLIKMLGLAAVAAVAAMAFLGASSAMAEFPTALCSENSEELTCPEGKQVELFTMLAETTTLLTSGILTLLCLHSKAAVGVEKDEEGNPITLGSPLLVKLHELSFSECGRVSSGSHSDCTVTVNKLPLLEVLKTAEDLGTVVFNPELPAEINIKCGFFINCTYGETIKPLTIESAEHTESAGNGMLTANEVGLAEGKGFLCPETALWDALYEPLEGEPIWIRS